MNSKFESLREQLTGEFPAFDLVRIRHFVHQYPDWAAGYLLLAHHLGRFCRYVEAHSALRRGASRCFRPNSAFPAAGAELYLMAGQAVLAERYIERALDIDSGDKELENSLGEIYHVQGRFQEALSLARTPQLLGGIYASMEAWDLARDCYLAAGDCAEAVTDIDLSRTVDSWSVEELRAYKGGPITSLLAGRRLLDRDPSVPAGRVLQALALAELHRRPEALKVARESPPLTALVLHTAGRYRPAANRFSELANRHQHTDFWVLAGSSFAHMGRLEQAEACYRQALARPEHIQEVQLNLALNLRGQGRYGEALAIPHGDENLTADLRAALEFVQGSST